MVGGPGPCVIKFPLPGSGDGYCSGCGGITKPWVNPNAAPRSKWWRCEDCGRTYSEAHPTIAHFPRFLDSE